MEDLLRRKKKKGDESDEDIYDADEDSDIMVYEKKVKEKHIKR